ncbi:MAG: UvrD-helicase domain-containing protein, partial [Lachnospiraceae bacterium]|nr:UvrD-helicase domain-containing protein [Lachnospiraceae bacterium]
MLSKEQLEAVSHGKGPMMVIAGPGSGKTRVLTERVKRLLDLTAPERICVITFARKAADEMKSRFGDMTDRETAQRVCFGTFHSVFLHWLKEWGLISHGTKVIDREEQDAWTEAWERLHKEGVPAADREAHTEGPREEVPLLCQGDEAAWNIYMADARSRDYLQYKREQKALDFEDILAMMDTAISFFGAYDSYDFFLVDEFQDIDPRQYR